MLLLLGVWIHGKTIHGDIPTRGVNCRGGWSYSRKDSGWTVGVSTLACMTAGDCDRSDIELCLRERVPWMPGRRALESARVSGPLGPSPDCGPRDPPPPPPPGLIINCRTELWSRASVTSLRDLDSYTADGTEHNHIKVTLTFEFNLNQHLYVYGNNKKCTSLESNFFRSTNKFINMYEGIWDPCH